MTPRQRLRAAARAWRHAAICFAAPALLACGSARPVIAGASTANRAPLFEKRILFGDSLRPADEAALVRDVTAVVKHVARQQEALPASEARGRIGIGTPLDQGGRYRQTALTQWLLAEFDKQARGVGLDPLPMTPTTSPRDTLAPIANPMDRLFPDDPSRLEDPGNWPLINGKLKVMGLPPVAYLLTSRIAQDETGRGLEVRHQLVRLEPEPAVVRSDAFPVRLSQALPKGADIFLLLDESGSMRDNDPDGVRVQAAHLLIDQLAAAQKRDASGTYRIALGLFANVVRSASVLAPLSLADADDVARLHKAIDAVQPNGNTNLDLPFVQVLKHVDRERLERPLVVVLLTDGNHTEGPLRHLWRQLDYVAKPVWRDVSGLALALGYDTESSVLDDIAQALGGRSAPRRVTQEHLEEDLLGLLFELQYTQLEHKVIDISRHVLAGEEVKGHAQGGLSVLVSQSTRPARPAAARPAGQEAVAKPAPPPKPAVSDADIPFLDMVQ